MKQIVFVMSRLLNEDSRAYKEAQSFVANGYNVQAICWDQKGERSTEASIGKIKIKHIRVPFSRLFSKPHRTPCILYFWLKAFVELLKKSFDVIHCCEMYTMPVGFLYHKIKPAKLVYDSYEHYPSMARDLLPGIASGVIAVVDRFFVKDVDCLIIPCNERRVLYTYTERIVVALNAPKAVKIKNKVKKEAFTIFYAGGLDRQSGAKTVVDVIAELDGVNLILAGWGQRIPELDKISEKNGCITYLGQITGEEAIAKLREADVTFAFYEPINLNNIYTASCKVFDAMMTGIPIIVNKGTAAARIIVSNKCGITVPYGDLLKLRQAIMLLKNDQELRCELGKNGEKAFGQKYDWNILEKKFIKDYCDTIYA